MICFFDKTVFGVSENFGGLHNKIELNTTEVYYAMWLDMYPFIKINIGGSFVLVRCVLCASISGKPKMIGKRKRKKSGDILTG